VRAIVARRRWKVNPHARYGWAHDEARMSDEQPPRDGQRRQRTPAELQALNAAERTGRPFLTMMAPDVPEEIIMLPRDRWRLAVGRNPESDIAITWDVEVSRAHALLELVGDKWTLVDDGLSSNGTWANGKRVVGRQILRHRNTLCFGKTQLQFYDPGPPVSEATRRDVSPMAVPVTPMQHKVLVALCRPLYDESSETPAPNQAISGEIHLAVDTVKRHLKDLFARFGLSEVPQNEKRMRLARLALSRGIVSPRDF